MSPEQEINDYPDMHSHPNHSHSNSALTAEIKAWFRGFPQAPIYDSDCGEDRESWMKRHGEADDRRAEHCDSRSSLDQLSDLSENKDIPQHMTQTELLSWLKAGRETLQRLQLKIQ